MRSPVLPVLAVALCLTVAGCGKDNATSSATKQQVTVKAGDTTCELSQKQFTAGAVEFKVENTGKDVTEVYVYGKGSDGDFDKIIGEVENIAPSTEREFEIEVGGGAYEVACKPGQKGEGIRTEIEVSGAAATSSEAAYDRELEVKATEYAFEGLAEFTAKVGEKIEFKLENKGQTTHNFELFGPDGKEVGEIDDVAPGKDGEVVVELKTAGTYTFKCGIGNHAGQGMKGTFTVTA
ncbi:MAG: cupredoxin domain-containing protein [Actinomycetota bacterium]|nr:cupredoxin domain-containing protein [Actinomycetota bacterium]